MFKSLIIILSLFSAAAFAGTPSDSPPDQFPGNTPLLIAMGPDPGGHTGAGVTPETTKTDRPEVDAARNAASGAKVENNSPAQTSQTKESAAPRKSKN
ncbi:MAG: hypothetical protein H7X76_01890 [Prolixibacteraceae bacterium]|nr:hypothetical protein [Burkholderiales bacterium]